MGYYKSVKSVLILMLLHSLFSGLAQSKLTYTRAVEYSTYKTPSKGTLNTQKRSEKDYVNLKDFCLALGCSLTYQWEHQRATVGSRAKKTAAVVSDIVGGMNCNGNYIKYKYPPLAEGMNGFLLSVTDATMLAQCLEIGSLVETLAESETIRSGDEPDQQTPLTTLIIDAGHGGHDLGTAYGSIYEKDLALFYAQLLKDKINQDVPSLKVILSRDNDRFVSLGERSRLANTKGASLFVSLHMNHADNPTIHGTETYVLSPDATDDEARKTSLLENESWTRNTKVDELPTSDNIKKIFVDLEQQHFIKSSALFASYVQQEVARIQGGGVVRNRGVKQAFFYVLSQAAMPAVLVEMGFLSSSEDRDRLMNVEFREKFVDALVIAVKRYHAKSLEKSVK